MANPKTVFNSLKDAVTGEGAALGRIATGEAPSTLNGSIGFSFRDSTGNVVLPQLNAAGEILVATDSSPGTEKTSRVTNATGSASAVDLSSITLTVSKSIREILGVVSCRRSALFQLVQINDVTTTILADFVLDAGQYSFMFDFAKSLQIASGASGAQTLKITAQNLDADGLSALSSMIACKEF